MTPTSASGNQRHTNEIAPAAGPGAHLKLARWWWAVGWALVLLIMYSTLAPAHYVPKLHIWDKLEHAGAFFGMTFWFAGLVRRRRYPALAFWMLLLGGGIEIAQGTMGFGRDMDIHDFYADAVGIACALALAYGGLGRWMQWVERLVGLARETS